MYLFDTEKELYGSGAATDGLGKINLTTSTVPKQDERLSEQSMQVIKSNEEVEKQLKGNFKELFQNKTYAKNLILMIIIWSSCAFGNHLLPYYLDTLTGNVFLYGLFSACAEVIAAIICMIVASRYPLKVCLFAYSLLSAVACSLLIFFSEMEGTVIAVLVMFANFGLISAFDIAYIINLELFPTIFMTTAYGCCNIFGRCISILSPMVARLEHPLPMIILTVCSGLGAVLVLFVTK
eukprot:CAMPEP_0170567350 /NCGR_PEP_ID=MMETSP0211-20121228/80420_1 /TAXON_ID=311385 /ORGANISM="Pseudokeronopsis sp., Strain OXSARD2" /LENGTH=236 /DNA_ID=CAMNT_0010888775 /DNA_START=90 /DNA_END=797 /DNA_ORIENTATION=-